MNSPDLTTLPSTDPTRLLRYRDGLYAADFLAGAIVHPDFFTWLAGHPSTLEEICAHFEIHPRPTDVLLTLCRANELVVLRDGRWEASANAQEHLVSGSPWSLVPSAQMSRTSKPRRIAARLSRLDPENRLDAAAVVRNAGVTCLSAMRLHRHSIIRLYGMLFLGWALLAPADLHAQNKRNQRKVVPLTKKGAAAELPTVKKVGGGMITVGDKNYEVPASARITVNGEPATLGDIKPGMQASVSGGVATYGKAGADTIYKATKISARADNKLEQKRNEFNRQQAAKARELNRKRRRSRR